MTSNTKYSLVKAAAGQDPARYVAFKADSFNALFYDLIGGGATPVDVLPDGALQLTINEAAIAGYVAFVKVNFKRVNKDGKKVSGSAKHAVDLDSFISVVRSGSVDNQNYGAGARKRDITDVYAWGATKPRR
jgi:hypothetical protein